MVMENSRAPGGSRDRLGAWGPRLAAAAILLSSTICFSGALAGRFILDDWPLIANNAAVHSLARWREWMTSDFWNVDLAGAQLGDRLRYFRPLVLASYALDWQLGGGSPLALHATNLLLHAGAALLALLTLRRWTGDLPAAFAGALIFGLHPSKAESVAWISGRPDLWLTIGVLLASAGAARRLRREPGGWALEAFGTALAYASKEHASVLAAFAFIECWVALGRPELDRAALKRCALAALPQVAVGAAYLGARAWLMPLRQFEISGLSPVTHLGLVLETLGRLHELALWPLDLAMMQGMIRTDLGGPKLALGYVALGAGAVAFIALGIVFFRRRRPALALALGLWLWLLLPVSNLVWSGFPHLTSPRFLYLPLLALAWGGAELLCRAARPRPLRIAAALVALSLGARAFSRTLDFRSPTTFWNEELTRQPELAVGYLFAVDHARSQGRPRQALALAAHAFEVTARDYSHLAQRAALIRRALELSVELSSDEQRGELLALDAFISDLMGAGLAALRRDDLTLEVPANAALRRQLVPHHPALMLLQADISVRLGENARALSLAEQATSACPRCAAEWEHAGLIALRAGDHARARAWLAGPRGRAWSEVPARLRGPAETVAALDAQLANAAGPRRAQLEFRRHSLLGLAGRAYASLIPYEGEIVNDDSGRLALAEAAARAGAGAKARQLLAGTPPADLERLVASWTRERDAPLDANDDERFEQTLEQLLARH